MVQEMLNNISGVHLNRNIQSNQFKGTSFGRLSNVNNQSEKSHDPTKQGDKSVTLNLSKHAQSSLNNLQFRIDENAPIIHIKNSIANPDSSNLKFHDAQYYSLLFKVSTDEANKIFGPSYQVNGYGAYNFDLSVTRYNELRDQVINDFSHDKDLLELNLNALDEGFEWHLNSLTSRVADSLRMDQLRAEAEKRGTPSPLNNHPVSLHKDFNHIAFRENTRSLMTDFAKKYIEQINTNGGDYNSALSSTLAILNKTTETASTNNLSFNDLMILKSSVWYENEIDSLEALNQARINSHNTFLNNTNLSENLKKILGIE